jgi:hypothetical protein
MFNVAGVSRYNGQLKLRFANDFVSRVKILQRNGHEEINLLELPEAMEKETAARYISTLPTFRGEEVQDAIEAFLEKRAPKSKREAAAEVAADTDAEIAADTEAVEEEATAEVEVAALQTEEEPATQELSEEDKLAAKRERDAARKRAKRAAERLAKQNPSEFADDIGMALEAI